MVGKSAKESSAWGTFADASSAQRSVTPQWTMPSSFPLILEAHGAVFKEKPLHVFLIHLHAAHPNVGF